MKNIFLLFLIYSFLGWLVETIAVFIRMKKIIPRGFLIGPWCPIYGFGAIGCTILLKKYDSDIVKLFVMATLLGSILEYLTSYIMEKIFKARWWDYSDHKYNINGRISLTTSLAFGFLGIIINNYINPFLTYIISLLPTFVFVFLNISLAFIFLADIIASLYVAFDIKNIKSKSKDITDEINNVKMKKIIRNLHLIKKAPNLWIEKITNSKIKGHNKKNREG